MELIFDPDVKAVAEFMQSQIPASRLVSVADGLAKLAPILWNQYQPESVSALRLQAEPISLGDQRTQLASSE